MQKGSLRTFAMTAAITFGVLAGGGVALADRDHKTFSFAAYGDAPYGTTPTDTAEFQATPAFIDSVNTDPNVSLVVHVGDIHSGKQFCTEAYDLSIFQLWRRFKDPVVYTPGDNEWTDCHKAAEGGGTWTAGVINYILDGSNHPVDYAGGDPISNLNLIRTIFFPVPGHTLGGRDMWVESQAGDADEDEREGLAHSANPTDAEYVENVMFEQNRVQFVTINLPGGSNNDQDVWYGAPSETQAQAQERADRTGADLRWLDTAFKHAHDHNDVALVIIAQADMWDPEKGAVHQTGYEPIVKSVADHTNAWGKPVLMFNGDSHVYQTGNPLVSTDPNYNLHPGYNVPKFFRIVVHGSTFPLEWLKVSVNPDVNAAPSSTAFGPFTWERHILP